MNWLVLAEMAGGSEDGRTILNSVLGEQGGAVRRCDSLSVPCASKPRWLLPPASSAQGRTGCRSSSPPRASEYTMTQVNLIGYRRLSALPMQVVPSSLLVCSCLLA